MIIFLYGPDSYRIRVKVQEIKVQFLKKYSGLALRHFDLTQEKDREEFLDFIKNYSIFGDKKLAILEPLSALDLSLKNRIQQAADSPELNFLIIEIIDAKPRKQTAIKPGRGWKFILEPPVKAQKFDLLSNNQLIFFIKKEAQVAGLFPNPKTIDYLIRSFGPDTWALHNEIEKLRLCPNLPLISLQTKESIFALVEGLVNSFFGSNPLVPSRLEKALIYGEDAGAIFNLLISEVRNLLLAKESPQKFENLRLHPFVIRKIKNRARLFKLEQLKNLYQKLGDFDIAVKGGRLNYDDCLTSLAVFN